MKEQWREIAGFEGLYEVSDMGRIRNKNGLVLKPRNDRDGYRLVNLFRQGAQRRYVTVKVHRVVAQTFLGPAPDDRRIVDHRHGLAAGDGVANLRWVSSATNVRNRHAPSRSTSGELGVCKRASRANPWQAYTAAGGRFKSIGHFATKPEAVAARRDYMEQHYG